MEAGPSERLPDFKPQPARGASTATRLWHKAQGWTEGTTLGIGDGEALNPNGVVAVGDCRRLVFRPPGHNPVGVEGHCRAITQGWRRANPGPCSATPLGLEFCAAFRLIRSLRDRGPAKPRVMTLGSPKLLALPRPVRSPRENGVRGHEQKKTERTEKMACPFYLC